MSLGTDIHGATPKNPPADADEMVISDSADGWLEKKLTTTQLANWVVQTPIAYTHGGTGSEARTVADKFRETASVEDFGAVGDGTTDDTDNINEAIDWLNSAAFRYRSHSQDRHGGR